MSKEYKLPPARIRSAYEAYIDDGGSQENLIAICLKDDQQRQFKDPPGSIYRVGVSCMDGMRLPYMIRVLKLDVGEYRFGHTIEELEAVAMLHGVYKKG